MPPGWIPSASNGATYYYVVQSVNPTGVSANSTQNSGVFSFRRHRRLRSIGAGRNAATAGNAQVSLNWTASPSANFYVIQRSTLYDNGGGGYNLLGTITLTDTVTGTTYLDPTTNNRGVYSYTVARRERLRYGLRLFFP